MLLNPIAGNEATFSPEWLRGYDVIPNVLNVYILVDPSKGKGQRSDRTAIAVIGIDQGGVKYLLDGACHRMKLTERWELIKHFKRKWEQYGAQLVWVGYEQYGMVDDIEVMKHFMLQEKQYFEIHELKSPDSGSHAKPDRIERLEPDFRLGRFYLPCVVHHPDFGGSCYWSVWTEEQAKRLDAQGSKTEFKVGQIVYRQMKGLTSRHAAAAKHRIVTALKRRDENNEIYDLTRVFIAEMVRHPFAPHDDLIDAAARIYDVAGGAQSPVVYEAQSTEPIGLEQGDVVTDTDIAYDVTNDPAVSVGSI
jgi:hypothetical protein